MPYKQGNIKLLETVQKRATIQVFASVEI